ncbi:CDC50/LEM3 FAMILY-RELATED [Salix viminalis]|uniref:ALA-interacting subunit n=1 Tax=Salix viminalis TaxID=40686 RepID=A0A9Q0SPC1_SALVM|nr:CDC50/LEM3 FAMILY-RELATED [Salix viminalis]
MIGEATSSGGGGKDDSPAAVSGKKNKKPNYSRFTQQELPACKPILTPGWVITSFIVVGVVFIPIGLASLYASEHVVEIVERYDKDCIPPDYRNNSLHYIQTSETDKNCTMTINVPKLMKSPVFIYYELDNFYQNHRRYVKSRSDKQLRSKASEGKKNIAWKSDQEHKFGSDIYPKNFQNGSLIGGGKLNPSIPLSEQVDLIVWMRTAALPNFRKLYGKIEKDLQANTTITVTIENNYNTYSFGGKKKLVLSTTSWIGGKNSFLGRAYIAIGGLCLFLAVCFVFVYLLKPRPLGDPSYLSWNRNPSGQMN